jgi:hypothetical protein
VQSLATGAASGTNAYLFTGDAAGSLEHGAITGGGYLAGGLILKGVGSAWEMSLGTNGVKSTPILTGSANAAESGVTQGTIVYRIWGDGAGAYGRSWTTVDPRVILGYRNAAGLPNQNTGRFLSEGILNDTTGIRIKAADPLHGNAGGLIEIVIPNPSQQIILRNVQGLNPSF